MSQDTISVSKPRLWTKNFVLIMLVNLFVFVSFHMLLPAMPVYIQALGATEDIVGLVVGSFTLTAVGLRPFAGHIIDTKGRKLVYFVGLIIIISSIILYDLVTSVALLLIVRLFHGLGWGASTTAAGTIATDVIPKKRLAEGMGFYGLTTVFSMAVAPILGLYIIEAWGFSSFFHLSTIIAVCGFILAFFIRYQIISPPTEPVRGAKLSLLEKNAYKPSIIIFFIALTYGSVITFIALYASQLGISNIGIFFTAYALTLLISRPTFGKMADKKGFNYVIIPGIISIALTMLILFFAKSISYFIIAAIFYGIGFGAVQPSLQAMAVSNVPPQRRGAANGTFMSGFDLGIGIGSVIWGFIAKLTSYSTMYLIAVVPVAIALFLYYFLEKEEYN